MSSRPSRGAARLAAILDALPDALVLVNANGTVVNANTIALEAFEAPGTALVGRGLLDLLPQFDSKLIPGSMRRPDHMDPQSRTKPTRMIARRTDGTEFPVEVTSANLENGQQAYDGYGYTGDELLMLVVRDLSGTVDTEAELARSQRQTEMILRAASEGVVGTDTDGHIVLVNPAAAQILGYRAGELGGKELHALVLHSRPDGSPFPYEESPLADTLRSGRKHRVRGQVLWSKGKDKVAVDLTTAPVRDGDQLVGAVMTFTDRRPYDALAEEKAALEKAHAEEQERLSEEHASDLTALRQRHVTELEELREQQQEEVAAGEERYAALAEREKDRYEALAGRHEQLLTLLGRSLRGPLDELRRELAALAADDAGQLWPEANQVLHHLSAGYARITTLIDNVLGYQSLDAGGEDITRTKVMLDAVVAAGVDGAVELIGPGRVQFAVHAPPIEAEVDPQRLATALAHLVADVAGVDATGNAPVSAGGYLDNTVVVAAAQRGEVARIEVRGPYAGGDPVHEPIVRGIVRAHGGVLQTHEVPGMSGSAYVLEVPLGGGAGAVADRVPEAGDASAEGTGSAELTSGGGRRRARRASTDAFLESDVPGESGESGDGGAEAPAPTGRRRRRAADIEAATPTPVAGESAEGTSGASSGTGRRRGRPAESDAGDDAGVAEGAVVTAAEHAAGTAAAGSGLGGTVPPQGVPVPAGRRARHGSGEPQAALPPALPPAGTESAQPAVAEGAQPTGRRRRALAAAAERAAQQEAGARTVFALPPAEADRSPDSADAATGTGTGPAAGTAPGDTPAKATAPGAQVPGQAQAPVAGVPGDDGRHDAAPLDQAEDHTPPQPHPTSAPTGRRRRAVAQPAETAHGTEGAGVQAVAAQATAVPAVPGHPGQPGQVPQAAAGQPAPGSGVPAQGTAGQGVPTAPAPVAAQAQGPGQVALPAGPAGQSGIAPAAGVVAQPDVPVQPGVAAPADAAVPAQGTDGRGTAVPPGRQVPAQAAPGQPVPGAVAQATPATGSPAVAQPAQPLPVESATGQVPAAQAVPVPAAGAPVTTVPQQWPGVDDTSGAGVGAPQTAPAPQTPQPAPAAPLPAEHPGARPSRAAQPLPAEAAGTAADPNSTQGRAISVRTLGQGVPFARQAAQVQQPTATPPPHAPGGSGRRRKLGTPPDPATRPEPQQEQAARTHPPAEQPPAQPSLAGQSRLAPATEGAGRSYAIGAPDANAAEGPEPLDGPGGAVEVADTPRPQPLDDELPPEPLDNPRRLLVWPAPDVTTQQALSDRGYRPVIVHSREEVDAQIAAFPAALFVDPLTGPITRTALQSLRQAAVAAEVPVLVTAGLGQATREAAYGADPAVLLKALAPRDSEQHPPRVLLIEEHAEIALALTATLERRGMQVARAASDDDAVTLAGQLRPNLVVMDLMQMHRRQNGSTGIIDWLRANGQLNRTPLVVYTAAVDQADLPRLASGETVLFLAERSTSNEVQSRIVDLLARIGTN
ncbi:PAS domain S-box-containing protein [Streptomyces griseochromogenes]|uniref:PAS domain S-box-containing protein n=1 Tax=Streptomyces griseochromogenes TaxID=68214 RepID=A0ABS4LUZ3_9ACTN|nr:PAS domain-containing protein [Streptomyces griseochromogenes]MBP2051032.1 PAS domain S-box-containing protein [Streptomyces griseochromogenes]